MNQDGLSLGWLGGLSQLVLYDSLSHVVNSVYPDP